MQKFNYHSHTYRCGHADFDMKDEDYVKEYIKMGFEKIAFTDHSPEKNEIDKRESMRMKYSQKEEYLDSIKKLREKYKDKIEIQTGYEVEYLPGEEENLLELKNETDKIILGQHFIYGKDKNLKILGEDEFTDEDLLRYAEYIEKALEYKIPNIVGHPDFYMLKRKTFGKIEEQVANMICKAAEKYNIPLEINLNRIYRRTYSQNKEFDKLTKEDRLEQLKEAAYPCKEFWEIATNYNIKVLYGNDTHRKGQILLWNKLIDLANEKLGKEVIDKLKFIEDVL